MKFRLRPILDEMEALYKMPRNQARFEKYLFMLQGNSKSDLILPIAGYNPMAKEQVLEKLLELKKLDAEGIAQNLASSLNTSLQLKSKHIIEIVLNIADDLGGAWTNRYATDFTSKFDLHALIERNFCTPYFWTSEDYNEVLIEQRVKESVFRSIFQFSHGRLKTLKDYVNQETYVAKNCGFSDHRTIDTTPLSGFYKENQNSDDYSLIFNFFYGDEASNSLGYKTYGHSVNAGFKHAAWLAKSK